MNDTNKNILDKLNKLSDDDLKKIGAGGDFDIDPTTHDVYYCKGPDCIWDTSDDYGCYLIGYKSKKECPIYKLYNKD